MAYSAAVLYRTVDGNKVQIAYSMTCDGNSGSIQTGLSVIEAVFVTVTSAATTCPKFKRNVNSAGTAANGFLFASSCTNGDNYVVLAIGH